MKKPNANNTAANKGLAGLVGDKDINVSETMLLFK